MEYKSPDFHHKRIESSDEEPAFNIFKGEYLIAEVRGTNPATQTVIPMRSLNDYEEGKFQEYLGKLDES